MRVAPTLIFAVAALSTGPATATHCPSGEFYRVKLDECVGLSSALARPFLGETMRKTAQQVRLAKRIDPGFVDPPPEAPDAAQSKADESDNWVWFPMPPVSAALWGYPVYPPVLVMG
jgi:hypothetical protein